MKKKLITLFSLLLTTSLLQASCQPRLSDSRSPTGASGTASLNVVAVESFLTDIAQNVAGDRLQVATLMPLGLDPHAFEPGPRDIIRIAESEVLIVNGAGFEAWLQEVLDNAGGQRQIIAASAGLISRSAREGEEAVMSSQEKRDAICADISQITINDRMAAGADPQRAVDLHPGTAAGDDRQRELELFTLQLNQASDGTYGGFLSLNITDDNEYLIATAGGRITVSAPGGGEVAVQRTISLDCAALAGAVVLDLEPGKYTLAVSGLKDPTSPLLFGPAGGHNHREGDPHFWLDPLMVIQYVENIRAGLSQADPAGMEIYARNAEAYTARLTELDGWIKSRTAQIPAERRLIVTNHESFGYFADRYGFKIIGTIVPSVSTGSSPSAQQMARLVDRIRSSQAIAIFLETGANPLLAEQISRETGVGVIIGLYTHTITPPGGEAPSYIDMMKFNVDLIVGALK